MKFKCNYCGTEYERPVDRAACEIRCDRKAQEKIKEEKQKKLQAEEDNRLDEIQGAWDMMINLASAFKRDYHKQVCVDFLRGSIAAIRPCRYYA